MKVKKLAKLAGKLNPQILVKDNVLVAINGVVLAEVQFEQTGDEKKKLSGSYKKAYFDGEIETIHDGSILYSNELLLEPKAQLDFKFPEYDNLLLAEQGATRVILNINYLSKLLAVLKEQREEEVEFLFKDSVHAVQLIGKKARGLIMPCTNTKEEK